MKLNFEPTISTIEYSRQTFGAQFPWHITEANAREFVENWDKQDGNVAILSSVKWHQEIEYVPECELGCRHCPVKQHKFTIVTWAGFTDVPPDHEQSLRFVGEKHPTVTIPLIPRLSLATEA